MLKIKREPLKNILIATVILIVAILLSGAAYFFISRHLGVSSGNEINYININNCQFKVEIADTSRERFLGLGKREKICENCGMLFEFPQKGDYSFCMRDMEFPLDFIWILDYNVASVVRSVPYNFEGNVGPHILADKVLELNAGTAKKCGIKKGDKIFIE